MVVLGINGGVRVGYQDVSAVVIIDGKIVAAVEEERLNRIKFSPGQISEKSVHEALRIANISINEVDCIATHGSTWGETYENILTNYFINTFGYCPPIKRFHHHDAHAASTYYASGYKQALIVTIDHSGDGVSTQIAIGNREGIRTIKRYSRPDSLGVFYTMITQYCGFVRDSDEYKLMGLSSYGDRNSFDWNWLLSIENGEYTIDPMYIIGMNDGDPSPTRQQMLFNKKFIDKIEHKKRLPEEPITDFYKNIAASAQKHFEDILLNIIEYQISKTGIKKICLAGGSALNCVANQKIMNSLLVDDIYIQPAAGDNGISLGAAYLASHLEGFKINKMDTLYLGSSYSDEEIEYALNTAQSKFEKIENPSFIAAKLVYSGKVVAWFQGSAEFGPRALGNRSILANPTNKEVGDLVNNKIKFRESYRPFCPSVLEEDFNLFFEGKQPLAANMTITYDVKPEIIDKIPAVVHIDNTARIQTVNIEQNELFYKFLIELKHLNGIGMSLNTSFNKKHEPIVNSPLDALATFYSCGLDALVIGNYLVLK